MKSIALPFAPGVAHGVMVGGVPIGETAYVLEALRVEAAEIVSYIETTVSELRDHPHYLWFILYYCGQSRLDYWLRHVQPSHTVAAAAMVDQAMRAAVEELSYVGMLNDDITSRRFELPARMRGCGLRSRLGLAPAAYAACFVEACEVMLDVQGAGGVLMPGFFPMLEPLFGATAFDVGGHRFTTFVASLGESAQTFLDVWTSLRYDMVGSDVRGPLDQPVQRAGADRGAERLQRAITAQREQAWRDELHSDLMALPVADPRRQAWLAVDRLSSQWVPAWPSSRDEISPEEFPEVLTTYMGCESRVVRAYAGQIIPCGSRRRRVCDAHGFQLGVASLPGGFTICHDGCASGLLRICVAAGGLRGRRAAPPFHLAHPAGGAARAGRWLGYIMSDGEKI